MTAKSNSLEKIFIDHVFAGVQASTYATLYVSLHTGAITDAGDQSTNEALYTGYVRQAVAVPGGWSTSASQAQNAAEILFPAATGGDETLTHFAIGTAASGPGTLLYHAALDNPVFVVTDVQPKFTPQSITVTED